MKRLVLAFAFALVVVLPGALVSRSATGSLWDDPDCQGQQSTEGIRPCGKGECVFSRKEEASVSRADRRSYVDRLIDYYKSWRQEVRAVRDYRKKLASYQTELHALTNELRPFQFFAKNIRRNSAELSSALIDTFLTQIAAGSYHPYVVDAVFEGSAGLFSPEQYVKFSREVYTRSLRDFPENYERRRSVARTVIRYSRFVDLSTEQKMQIVRLPIEVRDRDDDPISQSLTGAVFSKLYNVSFVSPDAVQQVIDSLERQIAETKAAISEIETAEKDRKANSS